MEPSSSHQRAFLTTNYLTPLITLLKQRGLNTKDILSNSQINDISIQQNQRISPIQYQQIVENAYTLSQDSLIGIKHGLAFDISSSRFLKHASTAAENLDQALSLAIRYIRTQTLLADLRFHKEDDSAVIQINRLASMPNTFPFVVENIIAGFLKAARYLIQSQEPLSAVVKLSLPTPKHAKEYEKLLGIPVLFNQPYNQICFPEFLLDSIVSTADITSRRKAADQCEKILSEMDNGQDLVTKIRHKIEQLSAFPTLPIIAETLFSSPRTINRQLAQLNTSYQQILDNCRREKAIHLLLNSNASIDKISTQLGYNDPSNFGRAFRRWLDQSPRSFRKHNN